MAVAETEEVEEENEPKKDQNEAMTEEFNDTSEPQYFYAHAFNVNNTYQCYSKP